MARHVDTARMGRSSIILVHGTWGRGYFPKRREASLVPSSKRWWFEEGSQFRARLDAALKQATLDWPVHAFPWSGANSIRARDRAAKELSDHLRKDLQDPNATAVIIAHSHGGNVALRSLQHLGPMADRIRVITLATPFLRVFAHKFPQRPFVFLLAVGLPIGSILLALAISLLTTAGIKDDVIGDLTNPLSVLIPVIVFPAGFGIGNWLVTVFTNLDAALAIEEQASYDTKALASRMLVIRGVDDEASLSLTAGAIGSRLNYFALVRAIPAMISMGGFFLFFFVLLGETFESAGTILVFGLLGCYLVLPICLFAAGAFKSAFGRELLVRGALGCDIAVDSVPDTSGQVEAITLKPEAPLLPSRSEWRERSRISFFRREYFLNNPVWTYPLVFPSQARHRIYNHPDCVDEIVRWLCRVM